MVFEEPHMKKRLVPVILIVAALAIAGVLWSKDRRPRLVPSPDRQRLPGVRHAEGGQQQREQGGDPPRRDKRKTSR